MEESDRPHDGLDSPQGRIEGWADSEAEDGGPPRQWGYRTEGDCRSVKDNRWVQESLVEKIELDCGVEEPVLSTILTTPNRIVFVPKNMYEKFKWNDNYHKVSCCIKRKVTYKLPIHGLGKTKHSLVAWQIELVCAGKY